MSDRATPPASPSNLLLKYPPRKEPTSSPVASSLPYSRVLGYDAAEHHMSARVAKSSEKLSRSSYPPWKGNARENLHTLQLAGDAWVRELATAIDQAATPLQKQNAAVKMEEATGLRQAVYQDGTLGPLLNTAQHMPPSPAMLLSAMEEFDDTFPMTGGSLQGSVQGDVGSITLEEALVETGSMEGHVAEILGEMVVEEESLAVAVAEGKKKGKATWRKAGGSASANVSKLFWCSTLDKDRATAAEGAHRMDRATTAEERVAAAEWLQEAAGVIQVINKDGTLGPLRAAKAPSEKIRAAANR